MPGLKPVAGGSIGGPGVRIMKGYVRCRGGSEDEGEGVMVRVRVRVSVSVSVRMRR